jgi:hypothetical protein
MQAKEFVSLFPSTATVADFPGDRRARSLVPQ